MPIPVELSREMSLEQQSRSNGVIAAHDRWRWVRFAVLLTGVFLSPLDFFIVNIALPAIKEEFGATPSDLQLVVSGYMTTYAVFLITGGRLGDIFGHRVIFLAGLAGFAGASAICGWAPCSSVLVAGRIFQGLGAALMVPQGLASINMIFAPGEKSLALGLYGATLGLAAGSGQILGGFLVSADVFGLGWRIVFLVNLPIAAVVLILGLLLSGASNPRPPRLDIFGVMLSALTLALVVTPLIEGREQGWPLWSLLLLMAAPIAGSLFLRNEDKLLREGGTPLFDPRVMGLPGFSLGLLAALFFYAIGAFFLIFSIYLQNALGESPREAALVFLPFGVGSFLAPLLSPYAGRMLGQRTAPAGIVLETIGILSLALVVWNWRTDQPLDHALRGLSLFAIGFGQGTALPSLLRAIISKVEPAWSGLISGIINTTLQVSSALSIATVGGLFFAIAGREAVADNISFALVVSLLAIACCLVIAALATVALTQPTLVKRRTPTEKKIP